MELDHRHQNQAWVLPPEPPDHFKEWFWPTTKLARHWEFFLWIVINVGVYTRDSPLLLGVILFFGFMELFGVKLLDKEDRHQRLAGLLFVTTCMISAIVNYFNQNGTPKTIQNPVKTLQISRYWKLYERRDDVGEIVNTEEGKEGITESTLKSLVQSRSFESLFQNTPMTSCYQQFMLCNAKDIGSQDTICTTNN